MGWSVALTYGACERKAVENLRRQDYEAFCPLLACPSKSDLGRTVESPLFPCYVFVMISPHQKWHSINNTYGVIRLLTDRNQDNPRPLYVHDEKIEEIRSLSMTVEHPLPAGTLVLVRARGNPFYEKVGTVVSMDKSMRVSVLMSILNRDVEIKFELAELEKL
jgi:transcription antitermination factor NusG